MVRRRWYLLALPCILATSTCLNAQPDRSLGLAPYMGRDLSLLSSRQRRILLARVARLAGDTQVRELNGDTFAYWVAPFRGSDASRMLFMANPNWDSPGRPTARVYLFTREWKAVASQSFSLGEWEFLIDARVSSNNPLYRDVLVVRVSPTALLHRFRPDDEQLSTQYYAEIGGRVALIRQEDAHGAPRRTGYNSGEADAGPAPPARDAGEWSNRLDAADPAEQAEALVWITGTHTRVASSRGSSRLTPKQRADGLTYDEVRSSLTVQQKLRSLRQSPNPWLRDYAALGTAPMER